MIRTYELGISEIDNQHWKLIDNMNRIISILLDFDRTYFIELIIELQDDLVLHFNYEERLMIGLKHPGFEAHQTEHIRLLQILDGLVQEVQNFSDNFDWSLYSVKLITSLKEIIITHIETFDIQIANFIHWKKL